MFKPLLVATFPLFTLSYLIKLSRIIKQHNLKAYIFELRTIAFALHQRLKDDKELQAKIIRYDPEKEVRMRVLCWNYVKFKFKYEIIGKLDYDVSTYNDLEEYYDEIFKIYLHKFDVECNSNQAVDESSN